MTRRQEVYRLFCQGLGVFGARRHRWVNIVSEARMRLALSAERSRARLLVSRRKSGFPRKVPGDLFWVNVANLLAALQFPSCQACDLEGWIWCHSVGASRLLPRHLCPARSHFRKGTRAFRTVVHVVLYTRDQEYMGIKKKTKK